MKAYKDSLKEEEVEEKKRKDEQLKGAKVVTGMTDAPASTGIGQTEPSAPGQVPRTEQELSEEEQIKKVEEYANTDTTDTADTEDTLDDQINNTKEEKVKIQSDLEQSKNNLKELESKLASINEMYAELKK
jgi:septal ring factor EnvC (AmiA/AmiB activator)